MTPLKALNVLAGASVTLNGTYFTDSGVWGPGSQGTASSLTNGVFLAAGTQWNDGSVWWNSTNYPGNSIVITLGGTVQITQFTVQADDNDTYLLEYWNGSGWSNAWAIPTQGPAGLQTRTSSAVNITTTQLRFTATGGDDFKAVSEIQAEGVRVTASGVPDSGSSALLLLLGLSSVLYFKRRS